MFLQVAEVMIHEGLEAALSLGPSRSALLLAKGALRDEGYDAEADALEDHLRATRRRVGRPRHDVLRTQDRPDAQVRMPARHIVAPGEAVQVKHGTGPAVLRVDGPYTLVTRAEARQG